MKIPEVSLTRYGLGRYQLELDSSVKYEVDEAGRPLFLDRLGWWPIEEKLAEIYNPLEAAFILTSLQALHCRMREGLSQLAHVSQTEPFIDSFRGPLW